MIDPNAWDWWVDANDRRQWLILTKHEGRGLGLSPEQAAELEILQQLAELIVNAASPGPWTIEQKAALVEVAEALKKANDKSSERTRSI